MAYYPSSGSFDQGADPFAPDDELERRRREMETLGALLQDSQGSSYQPDGYVQPEQRTHELPSALSPAADRAHANGQPREDTQNGGTDWGDAAANYGIPALAMFLDLVTNKGKGMGPIMAAQGIQANQRALGRIDQARDKMGHMDKERELDERSRYNDYLSSLQAERAQRQNGVAAGGGKAGKAAAPEDAEMRDANLDLVRAKAEHERGEAYGYNKVAPAPKGRGHAAVGGGHAAPRGELPEGMPQGLTKAQQGQWILARDKEQRALGGEGEASVPGLDVTDEAAAQRTLGDKVSRRKLEDGAASFQAAQAALKRMQELRESEGTMQFGDTAKEYETLRNTVMSGIGKAADAGVLQPSDIARFEKQAPEAGLSWKDITRVIGIDQVADSLKGTASGLRETANAQLGVRGFKLHEDGGKVHVRSPTSGKDGWVDAATAAKLGWEVIE